MKELEIGTIGVTVHDVDYCLKRVLKLNGRIVAFIEADPSGNTGYLRVTAKTTTSVPKISVNFFESHNISSVYSNVTMMQNGDLIAVVEMPRVLTDNLFSTIRKLSVIKGIKIYKSSIDRIKTELVTEAL